VLAEQRVGEMIAAQKATVGLAKPGPKIGSAEEPNYRPTLAEAGIDKELSSKAPYHGRWMVRAGASRHYALRRRRNRGP
jgi:hypothetical protein